MSKILILILMLVVGGILPVFGQAGYEGVSKRQQDADYFYIEFKTYFDKQDYYNALKKIEDAIDAAPLHYNIAHFYYDKGEIYRKLFDLNRRTSDIDEAWEAYRESARLDNRPQTVFRMNYCHFEIQKNELVKFNQKNTEQLGTTLEAMWQALLDYEEINAWEVGSSEALDEEFRMFLEKAIDAGLLSRAPNSYLAKIITVCSRGKSTHNPVVAKQWNQIEGKLRTDVYNLSCSGNLYLAHKNALDAIREQNERLYDHALNYYQLAVDTAQTREAKALIYNEMAHFVNSAPFYQLYDAVKYAEFAYRTLPLRREYAEEYGEFLWLVANQIIKVEVAGKESFAQKREKPKVEKALTYLEAATRFEWKNRIQALVLCSLYHEWLQDPWDDQQTELKQAQHYIITAFEENPDKNDKLILNQLVQVHKKMGAAGIRKLRELDQKYQMNISTIALVEKATTNPTRLEILLTQIRELQAELFEITLDHYTRFIEIKNKAANLSMPDKMSSEYQKLEQEIQNTKAKLDDLFTQKVDLLYRIGYSKPQETEIQVLSQRVLTENILNVPRTTREKVNQISIPDRMLIE